MARSNSRTGKFTQHCQPTVEYGVNNIGCYKDQYSNAAGITHTNSIETINNIMSDNEIDNSDNSLGSDNDNDNSHNNSDHIGIATADTKSDNDARNSENHNDNDSSDTNIGEMSK